jgi:hypothetical protein
VRRIRAFARTVEPIVYWLLAATLMALLAKTFMLDTIPAPNRVLHVLGGLADTLLRSLFGGTIFYITVTATKTYTDRKRLAPWLNRRLLRIVLRHQGFVDQLRHSAGVEATADMDRVLRRVKSSDPAPDDIYRGDSWGSYLQHYAEGIVELAAQVGRRGSFMDGDILRAVTELEHCEFLNMATNLPKVVSEPVRFSTFAATFAEYEELVRQLEQYRERQEERYALEKRAGPRYIKIDVADDDPPAAG